MFLTCVFKIHNPSKRKCEILDYVLQEYVRDYQELILWAKENEAYIRENGQYNNKFNAKTIAKYLPNVSASLHSSLQAGLKQDVAGNLASYFALKEHDTNVGFPTVYDPHIIDYENALYDMAETGVAGFEEVSAQLKSTAHEYYMPVFFAGADGATHARCFSLLTDTNFSRLLAVLFLLPKKHILGKQLNTKQNNLIRLDTGEVFNSRSQSALLLQLQVGENGWQLDKFLTPAYNQQIRVKTAVLTKKNNEYFLHVSFEIPCPKAYEPESYLGIDKGILITAAYAVTNTKGTVYEMGHFEDDLRSLQQKYGHKREQKARNGQRITKLDYKQKAYDAVLHSLANKLIEKALENKSAIIVEDLNVQVKGSRVVSRFRKLDNILSYKCKLAGVPFHSVFAAYSSMICHKCGEILERNDRKVVCPVCGYEGHSDDNAAVNIARRALYRKADWAEGYRQFHKSFAL